jgi:hypothetical protein
VWNRSVWSVMPSTLNAPGPSAATRTSVPVWLCDRPGRLVASLTTIGCPSAVINVAIAPGLWSVSVCASTI